MSLPVPGPGQYFVGADCLAEAGEFRNAAYRPVAEFVGSSGVPTGTLKVSPWDSSQKAIIVSSVSPCPMAAGESVEVFVDDDTGNQLATTQPTLSSAGTWVATMFTPTGLLSVTAECLSESTPGGSTPNLYYNPVGIQINPPLVVTGWTCTQTDANPGDQACSLVEYEPGETVAALRNGAQAFATSKVRGRTRVVATGKVRDHQLRLTYRKLKPGRYKVSLWVIERRHRINVGRAEMVIHKAA
jgi:hypothetical protein